MAYYSYKDVCYNIPPHIELQFMQCYGKEPDGDPNYDGNYWTLTGMWVDELQQTIETLKQQLKEQETK